MCTQQNKGLLSNNYRKTQLVALFDNRFPYRIEGTKISLKQGHEHKDRSK